MANENVGKIKITLKKSVICSNSDVRETVKSLGLGKLQSSAIQAKTPDILGKVRRVQHLIAVEEVK
ncbi:MAG TPA: 50S ribosomal protein L30 [Peptococcaceae bacterium]|nr:50S ribosomal protein L30 [Peptococcaceae bacterium]